MAAIELLGGPMDGVIHEIEKGFPVPESMSFRKHGVSGMHWYKIHKGDKTASFSHTVEDGKIWVDPEKRIAELEKELAAVKETCKELRAENHSLRAKYIINGPEGPPDPPRGSERRKWA